VNFRKAFSLVELLVVIIIVAILAAIAIPKFQNSTLMSKEAQFRAQLKILREAADRAEADTGLTFYPNTLTQRNAPSTGWRRGAIGTSWGTATVPARSWRGPYLDAVPLNPFTNDRTVSGTGTTESSHAWTHESRQTFNRSYLFYPSRTKGSDGREYREW
jgi:prepilin-type N-terminal cleavage/methylation domain-containing protein